ncbi:cytoskeleton protein RodZ [Vibrio sp. HA2012]|uniref:cytoskeleton protein RodZ n=1 Tax=Vibrio sp. HA2012 TaxID=1971595 RepID=UPI000C2BEB44|nr:cytoskeleton protein RodZ [Vibrio sp. HA2012]PJC86228.1 cytoskeleton protein RodZ [Vibrio sp. HA2012]
MSTETVNKEPEEISEPQIQAGDLLREARTKAGLSQREVADRLRLKLAVIESIDKNDFEFDHVATFTRGYLRSYAKLVAVDENVVLKALDGADEVQHKEHTMQSFSRKTKREMHDRRIMKLTWGIFIVIIGISSVWWYQNQQDTITEVSEQDAVQPLLVDEVISEKASAVIEFETIDEPEPARIDASVTVTEQPEADATLSEVQADSSNNAVTVINSTTVGSADAEVSAAGEAEPSLASVTQLDTTLVLNFSSDCWIQVTDASGKTLATGVKKPNTTLTLSGETPYKVILGAPEGVSITFASESVDLSGYTSGKVARLTLP